MDAWRYIRFLKDLDELCLRSLKSHGALTAKELAGWLNRESLLRTKPELTGIHRISVATAHDWARLAHRRDLVSKWSGEAGSARTTRGGSHWELTEQGRQAIHSKVVAFVSRLPLTPMVTVLITGGGLVAALRWLSLHQFAIVAIVDVLFIALVLAVPSLWFSRSEKRENPGIAVVAIETLRSAGKPIPAI